MKFKELELWMDALKHVRTRKSKVKFYELWENELWDVWWNTIGNAGFIA